MPRIDVELMKDAEGYPTIAKIKKRNRTLTATFNRDQGFMLEGQGLPSIAEILKLIYPVPFETRFIIPEPLQVVTTSGGKPVLFDDFETLLKWAQITGTVALDNTVSYNGDQSLKITCGALDTTAEARRRIPTLTGNYTLSFFFVVDDNTKLNNFRVQIDSRDEGDIKQHRIRYYTATWRYQGAVALTTFRTLTQPFTDQLYNDFHFFSLTVKDWIYRTVQMDNVKYDINQPGMLVPTSAETYGEISLIVDNVAGQEVNIWIDDLILTET